jgi:putative transposase
MKAQESESMHPTKIIRIDEGAVQSHIDTLVRGSIEETLNQLLDAEADRLIQARRYERTEGRKDTRAGHYQRKLHTKSGEVTVKMPKLRNLPFETAIIERYRRRESSVEEALVEMYLAGVSVRRVEDITEALWGTKVSPSTVSKLNQDCRFRKFWPPHFRKICPVWRGDELGQTRCRSMQRGEG